MAPTTRTTSTTPSDTPPPAADAPPAGGGPVTPTVSVPLADAAPVAFSAEQQAAIDVAVQSGIQSAFAAQVAEPPVIVPQAGYTAQDLMDKISRATALAHIGSNADLPAVPSAPVLQPGAAQVTQSGITFEIPSIPLPPGLSGTTLNWYPEGKLFRVCGLAFPQLVLKPGADPTKADSKLYQVATYGDLVRLDEETALFGLKARSVEPYTE